MENKFLNKIKKEIKNKKNARPIFNSREVIILMIISVLITIIIMNGVYYFSSGSKFTKVDSNVQALVDTYFEIINNYYGDVDEKKVLNSGIEGMLNSLDDPYTTYMDSSASDNFNITLTGSYKGLGMEVGTIDNQLTIVGIFKNSPANEVGLQLGDIIVSIDDKKSSDLTSSDFSKYVRNSEKDTFEIVVKRNNAEKIYNIERKNITLTSVTSEIYSDGDKKIGYIYMSIFANNTYSQFKEALEKLENDNISSLIIDLRDNSGGELAGASNMISLFLNSDKAMYQMQDKKQTEKVYSYGTVDKTYPIVILVNGNSASASEVMTAALKDNLNAYIIGNNTYGKGTVQSLLKLSTGQQYKITTKKWLTPNGDWINEKGIEPDLKVNLSEEYYKNPSKGNDNQLQSALKYLKEQ